MERQSQSLIFLLQSRVLEISLGRDEEADRDPRIFRQTKTKKPIKTKKNAAICMEEATSQEKIDRDKNTFWAKEYLERETDC